MPSYLLDANVFVCFQNAGRLEALVAAAAVVQMAMVAEVHAELTLPRPGRSMTSALREAARMLDGKAIPILEILLGTPEEAIHTSLIQGKSRGRGEAASTALAIGRLDLVFVTEDVGAARRAYRELPAETGRVMGMHAFVRWLVECDALTPAESIDVAKAAKSASNIEPPLWWAVWASTHRAELSDE